ncbi:hypothetical protein KA013_05270 [Patescibacteria group bacterium]|nr:hypothetical protein [Patescibacteria group bacterium]
MPSMKEAKVISRSEQPVKPVAKKKEKVRNEVDELIKKKSGVDELGGSAPTFNR